MLLFLRTNLECREEPENQGMRHVLQEQLLVFHVRQLAPVHHGLFGEGLEREVLDLRQVGVLLLLSVDTIISMPNAARMYGGRRGGGDQKRDT